jgi:hypothetical protein
MENPFQSKKPYILDLIAGFFSISSPLIQLTAYMDMHYKLDMLSTYAYSKKILYLLNRFFLLQNSQVP